MKKFTFALVVIMASLSVTAQDQEQDAKYFYWKYYMRGIYFWEDEFETKADSISDILDSIGVVRYQEAFKDKEQIFQKDFYKLLSFDPNNTDSTDIYLRRLGCFDILTDRNNFYFLKLHSKELLPYCFDFNKEYQRRMLPLLELTQEIKDSLLNNYEWYVWERVRLGDTITENRQIERFLNSVKNLKNSNDLQNLIWNGHFLLKNGTEKSLKTYLSALDCNKIFEFQGREESIYSAFRCLIAYRESIFDYYPQYCLLSEAYLRTHMDGYANRGYIYYRYATDYERRYINQLEEFCLKEFGIELHIKIPFFEMINYIWLESEKVQELLDKYK